MFFSPRLFVVKLPVSLGPVASCGETWGPQTVRCSVEDFSGSALTPCGGEDVQQTQLFLCNQICRQELLWPPGSTKHRLPFSRNKEIPLYY